MNTNEFLKYKIQKEDTLTRLAKRAGLNSVDLKAFHNKLCHYDERIYFEDLSYYKFIYIPLNNLSKQESLKEKYTERPSKQFNSQSYDSTYFVEEIFKNDDQSEFTLTYLVNLNFDKEHENHVSIQLSDYKKNGDYPDDKISLLALDCSKIIYPISVKISENGEIILFVNHENIVNKFRKSRTNIEEYHSGEVSKNYLDTFEASIKNEVYFLNQIKKSPIFLLLFPKLDWFYKTSSWSEKLFNKETDFELSAEYFHDDRILLNTIIKGKSTKNEELIISYQTEKHSKKIIEISADIYSLNTQHTIKIIPKT